MNLIRAGIYRLVVQHKNRLERHYGGDQRRHFQARGLAILSLVFSATLRVRIIAFLLIDTSLLPIQTKLVFLPLKLVMVAAFVASYVALLTFQVGISIGHCLAAVGERDASKLTKQADVAMYQDKQLKPSRQSPSGSQPQAAFAMTTG